jgi:starch synthase
LADVAAALPAALANLDIDVQVVLPGYRQVLERVDKARLVAKFGNLAGCQEVRLFAATLPETAVPIWIVDCPALFDRPGTPYQDEERHDWPDNAERFGRFNQIAAMLAVGELVPDWRADFVHVNDWPTAIVPLLLLSKRPGPRLPTMLTVHNLAYQGLFTRGCFSSLGLPSVPEVHSALEFYGQYSFLKGGISTADALTAVSPTYAKEILTPEFGCGLDGLLRERAARLTGIMNGANYRIWDPANDPYLACSYTSHQLSAKRVCKTALQREMALNVSPDLPLIVFMSRLAHQKMPDIMLRILPEVFSAGAQFALVSEGEPEYEHRFRELAVSYPGQVSVHIGYEEPLAHRLLAGADILMHPSRYEPCGLSPIYAMRYGTLPVVRNSGGTADSVIGATEHTIDCETANGFSFERANAEDLVTCVMRALELYRQPIAWRKLQACAMRQDFGWKGPAARYAEIYRRLLAEPSCKSEFSMPGRQVG